MNKYAQGWRKANNHQGMKPNKDISLTWESGEITRGISDLQKCLLSIAKSKVEYLKQFIKK